MPRLSVIIPTYGRREEPARLLDSLAAGDFTDCEVILVDQNPPGYLEEVVARGRSLFMDFQHLRLERPGLAAAKNAGAAQAVGEVICFPDDDAEFRPGTIAAALEELDRLPACAAVFGKTVDRDGRDSVIKFDREAGEIIRTRLQGRFVEATMFIRREVFAQVRFDESFGIGTFYGAEEGYDLVLRLLEAGARLRYNPEIVFYHPQKIQDHTTPEEIRRVFQYRCGFAHLCAKHRLYGKFISQVLKVSGYCVVLLFWRPRKLRYYIAELLGLFSGWIA